MLKKLRNSMWFRRLKVVGVMAAVIVSVLAGFLWYQEASLREARALIDEHQTDAALKLIHNWENRFSPTGKSQALRARCYVEDGRYAEAIQIFQTVGAENADQIHDWARAYLSLQQWADALPLLKDLRKREPDNPDVLHELAACQAKLGMSEEALQAARKFASYPEFSHRAWLLIGVIQQERGNNQKALEAWKRIAEFDPEYDDLQIPADEFLTQFASLQIELGNVADAAKLVSRALKIRETAEAHFQAGLAADLQGDTAKAKQHWQRAVDLNPYHLNSRESLARAAIAEGDGAKAEQLLKPVLQSGADRSSTAYLMERAAYLRGDREQAGIWRQKKEKLLKQETIDSTVRQILKENPNSYWGQVIRAYQFAERGNSQQAKQLLEQLPASEQEDPFVADLKKAVQSHGDLPAKDRFPVQLF